MGVHHRLQHRQHQNIGPRIWRKCCLPREPRFFSFSSSPPASSPSFCLNPSAVCLRVMLGPARTRRESPTSVSRSSQWPSSPSLLVCSTALSPCSLLPPPRPPWTAPTLALTGTGDMRECMAPHVGALMSRLVMESNSHPSISQPSTGDCFPALRARL